MSDHVHILLSLASTSVARDLAAQHGVFTNAE